MDEDEKKRIALAERKFGLIAPVVNGTCPEPSAAAYFRRIAAEPLEMPDGTLVRLKPSTMSSWLRRYREHGFEGLVPKKRSDLGYSRRIDSDLAADIEAMRAEHPRISAAMAHERLVAEGYVAKGELSVATVQRWFKRNPLQGDGSEKAKDRRAFEAARVNGVWQADTLYGPYVGTPARRAFLQTIIDDKSRKIVASRFVGADNAATFQGTLKAAVASHGIPSTLYVDNGGPYRNEQLSLICGGLGIVLSHAPVRDGAAKGKIERLNRTVRMRFLSTLPAEALTDMDALNAALAKWVAWYNANVHSTTKRSPNEAFSAEADSLRWVDGDEALEEAFRNRIRRMVAKDATVRVDRVLYDAPMGMIGEKVELRYTPGDRDDVWAVMPDGSRRRLAPTDRQANACSGRVKPAYSIDFSAEGGR